MHGYNLRENHDLILKPFFFFFLFFGTHADHQNSNRVVFNVKVKLVFNEKGKEVCHYLYLKMETFCNKKQLY